MKKIIPLLSILYLTACFLPNKQDSTVNKTAENQKDEQKTQLTKQHWEPLHSGLWQSHTGEIGFKVAVMNPETLGFTEGFITHIFGKDEEFLLFSQVIDIESFHNLNNSNYYKDKNHLYRFNAMAGGGTFSVFDTSAGKDYANYDSFEVLSECFAKDNQQIFHFQHGHHSHTYDYASFQTCASCGCVAKDKNTYYVVGQELNQAEVDIMIADTSTYEHTLNALKVLQNK